jgi:FAD/FMN-containing dehydrogenase
VRRKILGLNQGPQTARREAAMQEKLELNKEYPLPGEEENAESLVEHEKRILRERYERGNFLRDFHSKTHAGVKAKFIVEANLDQEFRYGVFKEPKTWPAWIRFSNAGETVVPDIKQDARGFAIKLMGVPSEKLLEAEKNATTQDFILFTPETFFTDNAFQFFDFIKVFHSKKYKLLKLTAYFIQNPKIFWVIFRSLKRHANLLEVQYFSATPYLLGTRAVKYSVSPWRPATSTVPPKNKAADNYLRERLVNDLTEGEARFDLLVQFQADPYKTPIEKATVAWPPSIAPFHKVATIVIPPQKFDTKERREFTENLSMNPWHALAEHRPLGNVNRTRRKLYNAISAFRHEMNQQIRQEPSAGEDFFNIERPDPFADRDGAGGSPVFRSAHWSNWEGTYQCDAELVHAGSLSDLRAIIEYAKGKGKTIRVSGGGENTFYSASFSGSPVVQNEGQIIVYVSKMNRGCVHADGSNRITVEAGMTLGDVDALALKYGLCLETTTAPTFIEAGGAIALSCHGSGNHHGTISDLAVAVDIVTHDGTVERITKEANPELFRAAQVNLGALGIVHTITFQCVPRFKLVATDELADLQQTIANVQSLVESHDYVELFWFPFTNKAWIKKWDKVPWDTPDQNRPDPRQDDFQQQVQAKVGEIGLGFLVKYPQFTPPLCNLLMATTKMGTVVAPAPTVFHYTRYFPRRLLDLSYAIETGDRFEKFQSAWNIVTQTVCSFAKPRRTCHTPWSFSYGPKAAFPQNFLMHARFFKSSEGYLAPAVDFKRTVMMEAITYIGSDVREFYDKIEQHWISLGGRPHWGKTYNPNLDFEKLYGDNIRKFNAVRERMDPQGLFLNDFLRHVLGISNEIK